MSNGSKSLSDRQYSYKFGNEVITDEAVSMENHFVPAPSGGTSFVPRLVASSPAILVDFKQNNIMIPIEGRKKRINGHQLAQNVDEQVVLLGTVGRKGANGTNIEIVTTDGCPVNVTLPEPIDQDAEGYIEVHGTLHSKSTMACSSYLLFPRSMTEDFDPDDFNEIMMIMNVIGPELEQNDVEESVE